MIKKHITKIGYVSLCALIAIFFFAVSTPAQAATKEVTGYAWSGGNIGWISFNCSNTASCGTSNYKVLLDDVTGNLSGHAWSSNIGWISFNQNLFYPCPSGYGPCQAHVDISGNGARAVTGWVRACSATITKNCDGTLASTWDGWIHLSGTNHESPNGDGVYYNTADGSFSGFAWGADVTGWIQFSTGMADVKCPTCTTALSCNVNASVTAGQDDIYLNWNINNDSTGATYSLFRNGSFSGFDTAALSGNYVDNNLAPGTYRYELSKSGGPVCYTNDVVVTNEVTATGRLYLGTNPNTVQTSMDVDDYVDVRWNVDPTLSCSSTQISGPATISAWTSASIGAATGVQRVSDLVEGNYVLGMTCANASGTNVPINTVRITVQRGYIEEL